MNDRDIPTDAPAKPAVSRRSALGRAAAVAALGLARGPGAHARAASIATPGDDVVPGGALTPRDAIPAVVEALERFPLVALAERHLLQEWHDFATALLLHPTLPARLTDIVVEFGNALHQEVADRYVLEGKPVAASDLQRIWRHTIGGNILWDAPVYAQFFRTVRAANAARPPGRRLRVLLADPPFDPAKVRGVEDGPYIRSAMERRDAHYAGVVEREVVQKGRRALLIAGAAHLLRGLHTRDHADRPNAATLLTRGSADRLFVIEPLILPPDPPQAPLARRVQAEVARWPRPAVAPLAGTWLGATTESLRPWLNASADLAEKPEGARYGAQADAVLYLGPGGLLTASQADPSLYHWGEYARELQRLSRVAADLGQATDLVAEGLRRSQAGPSWFEQWS
jgi:hypothetical protein